MFISYAQQFEDVMLHRVFDPEESGLYIDVGAWHPDIDSVTKHFYDRGWSGINIEPSKFYFRILEERRSRDTNLNVAVGSRTEELDFVEIPGSGLSSLRQDAVMRARRFGFSTSRYKVPVVTLQSICDRYCSGRLISFLKIDVEGAEKDVIDGLDWQAYRPVVVLVEAVHPDTREPAWDEWEPTLLAANYTFVWFDGLNRYYLRTESAELRRHFAVPPGLFDGFVIHARHPLSMSLGKRVQFAVSRILPVEPNGFVLNLYRTFRRGLHKA